MALSSEKNLLVVILGVRRRLIHTTSTSNDKLTDDSNNGENITHQEQRPQSTNTSVVSVLRSRSAPLRIPQGESKGPTEEGEKNTNTQRDREDEPEGSSVEGRNEVAGDTPDGTESKNEARKNGEGSQGIAGLLLTFAWELGVGADADASGVSAVFDDTDDSVTASHVVGDERGGGTGDGEDEGEGGEDRSDEGSDFHFVFR